MTPRENTSPAAPCSAEPARVYAARLDGDTCPACAAHAGLEYPSGHPLAPVIPNASCTHPGGCRCAWL